ncbi:hypothetical protein GLAREA_00694 [Glarea lozoyensis ATCC 20868]|uniref:Uncharacterized protein n=1 Tax=Glarea lozoyensis (strain ATCC 20868 / MF5171) TaxID=1116229 RepID=S3CX76_GLAL2|nr:uncharacterized protein GLAREA_00694 [Glarea lozoyensis ATCC 20868]EPE29534.1 hypothetical protein GLAREA_00694 [Glarea lozoyensis ATCC 20868]
MSSATMEVLLVEATPMGKIMGMMGQRCGWNGMKAQTQLPGHNTTTLAAGPSPAACGIIACSRVSSLPLRPLHYYAQEKTASRDSKDRQSITARARRPSELAQMSVCFQVLIFVEEMMMPI